LVLAGEGQIAAAFGLALRLSSSLYFSGDHEEAERMWLAAADAADGHGDHHTAATCRLRAAIVLATDRMRPQQAAPLLDSVVMTLERHGDLPSLASAQAMRAYTTQYLSGAGRSDALDRAERDARTAALLARKVGNPHAEFAAQRALGLTLSKLGRDEDAIVSCRLAARTAERVEMPAYRGLAMWSLAEVYHRAGEYDLALGAADEGLAHTGAAGHDLGIAYFHRGRGRALAGLDRHDEAAVAFTNAVEAFERQCLMELAEECRLGLAQVHRALDHEA
jgi:tetratricopeptide (TPR) repeat protein